MPSALRYARSWTLILSLLSLILATTAAGQETGAARKTVWRATARLPAAEANQAAAADEKYAYAIDNAVIARHDRETGKLVDRSSGQAKHLNSGFLYEGKLYCAHSNYPRRPEQSEILVLDLKTMALSTFHEFGNFGGSLTWVVRHDDAWWCNFAKYGQENEQTFLVRFDDQWREQARYTYPPAVVRKLGTYSVSGGVWREGSLLVTDHDHGVLYRLRLPEEGSVLELVEEQRAPFTGQGIAADPLTGGLVGIDRSRKQIVFAEAQATEGDKE